MPKAWKLFERIHYTWSTLEIFLGRLRSVGTLATLIANVVFRRDDLMKGGELRTYLSLEDWWAYRQIETREYYLGMGISLSLG
jgi:hypothetical protein